MPPAHQPRLVLSTVGASLLYQNTDQMLRNELNQLANLRTLSSEQTMLIQPQIECAYQVLAAGNVPSIRKASAELNGIYALYDGQIARGSRDHHVLIATDTLFGRHCAEIVAEYLRTGGIESVEVKAVPKLTTADSVAFQEGCKELMSWCASYLPPLREQGYLVFFNLVAAFKALQGYLNTIGMFYADQILYLFEGPSAVPIFIPRLPIRIDLDGLRNFALPLALMAEGEAQLLLTHLHELPETLYDHDGVLGQISQWGLLIWRQMRDTVLSESLLSFPRIIYESSFRKDFERTSIPAERVRLQSKLALVAAKLDASNGDPSVLKGGSSGGVLYDNYVGKSDGGIPIGHFRISDGARVSCSAQNGGLVLRHFGPHDHVNKNP